MKGTFDNEDDNLECYLSFKTIDTETGIMLTKEISVDFEQEFQSISVVPPDLFTDVSDVIVNRIQERRGRFIVEHINKRVAIEVKIVRIVCKMGNVDTTFRKCYLESPLNLPFILSIDKMFLLVRNRSDNNNKNDSSKYIVNKRSFVARLLMLLILYVPIAVLIWGFVRFSYLFIYISISYFLAFSYLYCCQRESSSKYFFFNGWNAWSFCGAVGENEDMPMYSLPSSFVHTFHSGSFGMNQNLKNFRKLFLIAEECFLYSEMFGVFFDSKTCYSFLAGFLSQKFQFGAIGISYYYDRISCVCDFEGVEMEANKLYETDWLFTTHRSGSSVCHEIMSTYFDAIQNHHGISSCCTKPQLSGWCSWYQYYQNISDTVIDKNCQNLVSSFHKLNSSSINDNIYGNHRFFDNIDSRFDLVLVDDGYCRGWGDWLETDPKKFPLSATLRDISRRIHKHGLKSGIWLAPFAMDKTSKLALNHPEWILYSTANQPANSSNCGKWFYGLDITHPHAMKYVIKVLETIKNESEDSGFDYLKLDFLYAAVVDGGRHHFGKFCRKDKSNLKKTQTRAQIMTEAMKLIRNTCCNLYLLGCGAPLGSTLGFVDSNRISADAGSSWNPQFPLPWWDEWNLPCARNMIRNSITRSFMHQKCWNNDPDCILLRKDTSFTLDEFEAMIAVKAWCQGSIFISDALDELTADRKKYFWQIFPPLAKGTRKVCDLLCRSFPEILIWKWEDEKQSYSNNIHHQLNCSHTDSGIILLCNWQCHQNYCHYLPFESFISSLAFHSSTMLERHYIIHIIDFWKLQYGSVWVDLRNKESGVCVIEGRRLDYDQDDCYCLQGLSIEENAASDLVSSIGAEGLIKFISNVKVSMLPNHGCRALIVKCFEIECIEDRINDYFSFQPAYLGSSLHLSGGQEVTSFLFSQEFSDQQTQVVFYRGILQFSPDFAKSVKRWDRFMYKLFFFLPYEPVLSLSRNQNGGISYWKAISQLKRDDQWIGRVYVAEIEFSENMLPISTLEWIVESSCDFSSNAF